MYEKHVYSHFRAEERVQGRALPHQPGILSPAPRTQSGGLAPNLNLANQRGFSSIPLRGATGRRGVGILAMSLLLLLSTSHLGAIYCVHIDSM